MDTPSNRAPNTEEKKHHLTGASLVSKYPSRAGAIGILSAAGCATGVIRHCTSVARIALEIVEKANLEKNIDHNLIEIGALLHDLGRSQTATVKHGVLGAEMAKKLDLDEALVSIIAHHVGAGIPSEEAEVLGLPPHDYLPITLEEKIVCYADKLVMGNRKMSYEEAKQQMVKELGPTHPAVERLEKLHREILDLGIEDDGSYSIRKNSSGKKK